MGRCIPVMVLEAMLALILSARAAETVKINVDRSEVLGKIRRLNGGNQGSAMAQSKRPNFLYMDNFRRLNLPMVRISDDSIPGIWQQIGDVSRLFPNFHADVTNPDNYYFRHTDDYLYTIFCCGAPMMYRLGESTEFSRNKYFIHPPADAGQWADIVWHIIRHYNEGWADGFHFNIADWEIWNRPDSPGNWTGSAAEYNDFYCRVARELKQRRPKLKFGGPAHSRPDRELRRDFLARVRDTGAPLDFFSYQCYDSTPFGRLQSSPAEVRRDLDEFGFKDTPIYLSEWNYVPENGDRRLRGYTDTKSADHAAFIAATLSEWVRRDVPLGRAFLFSVTNGPWGLTTGRLGSRPAPAFYGMMAFGELAAEFPTRIKAGCEAEGVSVLAGRADNRECALLISCWRTGPRRIEVKFAEKPRWIRLRVVDGKRRYAPVKYELKGDRLFFNTDGTSSVAMVVFG